MSIICIFGTKMQYLYFFLQQVFLNKTKTLTCETLKNHIHAFFLQACFLKWFLLMTDLGMPSKLK